MTSYRTSASMGSVGSPMYGGRYGTNAASAASNGNGSTTPRYTTSYMVNKASASPIHTAAANATASLARAGPSVTDEVVSPDQLRADNKLLAMKLKYLQSVTTIYRQRVASITREALTGMGFGAEQDRKIMSAIGEAEASAMGAMNQFDAHNDGTCGAGGGAPTTPRAGSYDATAASSPSRVAQTRALLYGAPPSLSVPANEADFWRQQFLNLIAEMRPISVHDAEVLVNSLHDRKVLQEEVNALRAAMAAGGGDRAVSVTAAAAAAGANVSAILPDGTSPAPRKVTINTPGEGAAADGAPTTDLVTSPTPAHTTGAAGNGMYGSGMSQPPQINMVLVSPNRVGMTGRSQQGTTASLTPEEAEGVLCYPSTRPATLEQALQQLQEEQTKNKVQRVRLSSIQKQMNAREEEFSKALIVARTENLRVIEAMKALEKDRGVLSQQNHDLKQQIYVSEKTVNLKENQLQRQVARTTSVEKELQAAVIRMRTVFEQEEDRRAAESAALQQAFDEQRRLQTEIQLLKANLEGARRQQEDTDAEVMRLQTTLRTNDSINGQLRSEINKMQQDKLMSEWEADSMLSLLPRMDEATTELEQFFTFRETKIECERMNGQLRSLNSVGKSLMDLNRVIEARNNEITLLRAECDRAVSLGIPPAITAIVDSQILDMRKPVPRPKPHVMLRQQGPWMEIRDTGSGKVVYVTSDIVETPFCPAKVAADEERETKRKEREVAEEKAKEEAIKKAIADAKAAAYKEFSEKYAADAKARAEEDAKKLAEMSEEARKELEAEKAAAAAEAAKAGNADKVAPADNAGTAALQPLKDRLVRLLNTYDKPKLVTVDKTMSRWIEDGLFKLVALYGAEPTAEEPLPTLPEQAPVGGDAAADIDLQPHRRRLIRMLDMYDKDRLCAVDAYLRQHPTPVLAETLLKKLTVRYGPEPADDEDAKLPTLPDQVDEVPPYSASPAAAAMFPSSATGSAMAVAPTPSVGGASSPASPHSAAGTGGFGNTDGTPTPAMGSSPPEDVPPPVVPEDVRPRLYRLFKKYAPEKLANIDLVLSSFEGEYDLMFEKLVAKYGPEPADDGADVPDLPAQVTNPLLAARKRAATRREASPPSILHGSPGRAPSTSTIGNPPSVPSVSGAASVASPSSPAAPSTPRAGASSAAPKSIPTTPGTSAAKSSLPPPITTSSRTSTPTPSTPGSPVGKAAKAAPKTAGSPTKSMPKAAPKTTATTPKTPAGKAGAPSPKSPLRAASPDNILSPSPSSSGRKAPPPAAVAAMNAAKSAPPKPADASVPAAPAAGTTSPRKAPPAAAIAAMNAAKGAASPPSQSDTTRAPSPSSPKAPPAAAIAAMNAAKSAAPGPTTAPVPAAPNAGTTSPRKAPPAAAIAAMNAAKGTASPPAGAAKTAKAPPAAALAAMRAAAGKPKEINNDDI